MKNLTIKRGDIFLANLEPVRGSEQGSTRPVLIIQNNISNEYSPTTIIAPITSQTKRKTYVTNVPLSHQESKLDENSVALCNQIRTIDKSRIIKKISSLNLESMKRIDLALKRSLDLVN